MSTYQLTFSFREPYQVLLDAAFIRTCHAFHMPLQKYLDITLHGNSRIFVTQCTLAKIMAEHERSGGRPGSRPDYLPPPKELPLRYCAHKNDDGEDLGVVGEAQCLLDLLAGQPHGNELVKNKQHYVLASADPTVKEQRRKGYVDIRERARMIPGVPIVYVTRSVMILEDLSRASENARRGQEKEKFREGLIGGVKRKRDDDEDSVEDLVTDKTPESKLRGSKKAKGPNPLSVLKKKTKPQSQDAHNQKPDHDSSKQKRRGKRGGKKGMLENGQAGDSSVPQLERQIDTAESLNA